MADPRFSLMTLVTESFFSYVRSELKAGRLRIRRKEARETAIPAEGGSESDCLPCTVHRSAAEGYLLLQGLSDTYEQEGQIPPGTGGTVHLARALFLKTDADAASIGAEHPEMRAGALALQGEIATLTPQLANEVRAEDTPAIAQQGHQVWVAAYALTRSYYRQDRPETPEVAVQNDPLFQWMQRVKEEDMDAETAMKELKGILSENREEVASHA